jgi:hypothetical protein
LRDLEDDGSFEASARRAWAQLVGAALPAAAEGRGWPVRTPAGFERILLDHALCAPWETTTAGRGVEAVPLLELILALEMGERVLDGDADVSELNRRSLALRAARTGAPRGEACCLPTEAEIAESDALDLMKRAIAAQARTRRDQSDR